MDRFEGNSNGCAHCTQPILIDIGHKHFQTSNTSSILTMEKIVNFFLFMYGYQVVSIDNRQSNQTSILESNLFSHVNIIIR